MVHFLAGLTGPLKGTSGRQFSAWPGPPDWRVLRHLVRCFMIQSVKARSKPISYPSFSDSIHLCLRISSRSAWNSRYREEFLTKASLPFGVSGISLMGCINLIAEIYHGGASKTTQNWTFAS